jgi:hypothetical protein
MEKTNEGENHGFSCNGRPFALACGLTKIRSSEKWKSTWQNEIQRQYTTQNQVITYMVETLRLTAEIDNAQGHQIVTRRSMMERIIHSLNRRDAVAARGSFEAHRCQHNATHHVP